MIIYAGTSGKLDAIPVDRLADYEKGLFDYIEQRNPQIFIDIRTKKALDDTLKATLDKVIADFTATFA